MDLSPSSSFSSISSAGRCSILLFLSLTALLAIGALRRLSALPLFGERLSLLHPLLLLGVGMLLLRAKESSEAAREMEGAASSRSTLFLLDRSLSMSVRDSPQGGRRIDQAKNLLDLLLKGEEGAWVALYTLSGELERSLPLTFDIPLVRLLLEEMTLSPSGTDYAKGFKELYESFKGGYRPDQILLISDGEELPAMEGRGKRAFLERIESEKIPLFTVGVGSRGGGKVETLSILSKPNFRLLQEMAEAGGGSFTLLGEESLFKVAERLQGELQREQPALPKEERPALSPKLLYSLAALLLLFALALRPS